MATGDTTARGAGSDWYSGPGAQEWAVWHVLCEIWALQRQLPERKRLTEAQIRAAVRELNDPGMLRPGTAFSLTPVQCHLLVQLRLLSALTARRPGPGHTPGLTSPNLGWTEPSRPGQLAGPPELFDGLLTLATGVVQVLTGFHVVGGIAAMLHGALKIAGPDSPITEITDAVRKSLTPGITAIQESVKLMAPLPDNGRSGLRGAMCLAAHEITGVEVGVLNHQLFPAERATRSAPDPGPVGDIPAEVPIVERHILPLLYAASISYEDLYSPEPDLDVGIHVDFDPDPDFGIDLDLDRDLDLDLDLDLPTTPRLRPPGRGLF